MFSIFFRIFYLYFINILDFTVCFNIDVNSPIIYKGPHDSYFGYTVGLVKTDEGSWVLIGAPKSNDSYQRDIESPGALYRCRYPKIASCEQMNVDDSGNSEQRLKFKDGPVLLHHQKNNQWLGVSLDVNPVSMDSVVVCAHRWKDSYLERNVDSISHMNGLCYLLPADFSSLGQPIPALTKWPRLVHTSGYAMFSMGSLGMSARFSEKEGLILMGAPGLNDFTGGVVIGKDSDGGNWDYIEPPRNIYQNSYVGSSVTTGKFIYRGTYSVAMGAPRSGLTGKVMIYRFSPITEIPISSVYGEQLGSYFGSALCVINYDDDHYDDLLIGAPMYAENGQTDQGRVYVYISIGPMGFRKANLELKGSGASFARFGSALVNLGDINLDGYNDIAVGAPYEDDGHGVVYIYNGFINGLWPDFTQRISAKVLNNNLLGFGISFSRPYDMDRNGCNDIAVGSYMSNQAVLLRARPIINVTATLELSPKAIDPETNCNIIGMLVPCIRVKICFFYSGVGEGIPPEIQLNYTLTFDSERFLKIPRVVMPIMSADGLQEVTSISGEKMVYQNVMDCNMQHAVYVKSVIDKHEDIVFDLKYSPSQTISNCELCPVFSVFNGTRPSGLQYHITKANSTFLRDCGIDNICYSNLSISGTMEFPPQYDNQYILNETDNFSVNITLENFGEKAYDTRIKFFIPSNIEFREIKIMTDLNFIIPCTIKESTGRNKEDPEVDCIIGELEKIKCMLLAEFATIEEFTRRRFQMRFKVETSSTDLNVNHNEVQLGVAVKRLSEIAIYGAAVPDQLNVRSGQNVSNVYNFTHIYELYNRGPNMLEKGHVVFRFPAISGLLNIQLERIDKDWGMSNKCIAKNFTGHAIFAANLYHEFAEHTSVNMACHNLPCMRIICPLAEMPRDVKVKYIVRIYIRKNITEMFKAVKNIEYISDGTFEFANVTDNIIQKGRMHLKVRTDMILPKVTKTDRKFHLWIIILSVVCGLLCFLTFSVLLWKCGFFKRQQRDDLQRLLEHRNTLSRARLSDNSLESNDNEGSHENLVMTTPLDFQDVTSNGYYDSHIQNGHRSTIFDDNSQYLEPIQRLL